VTARLGGSVQGVDELVGLDPDRESSTPIVTRITSNFVDQRELGRSIVRQFAHLDCCDGLGMLSMVVDDVIFDLLVIAEDQLAVRARVSLNL
jgi:hypothetical protein